MANTLEHSHDPLEIAARLRESNQNFLKDGIYGAIDGAVTTFAIVSGVAGAGLSPTIVIILGSANLVGDGFSMAASNFLGTRAENQRADQLRQVEQRHIEQCPEGEREEVRQILASQGFDGELLEAATIQITSNQKNWIETMLRHEYGIAVEAGQPLRAATVTFVAFVIFGAIPLLPYVAESLGAAESLKANGYDLFGFSSAMTAVAFFLVGALKSRFVQQRWWLAGSETLIVGAAAAALAFIVEKRLASFGA
ncbi:MAG: hypothetical protein GY904_20795 [Planctomycetaceae bacterium]|nr:hypothetical protein [Planctomycetaceae bacterium]